MGSFTEDSCNEKKPPAWSPSSLCAGRRAEARPGPRDVLTPRCRAVLPLLSAASAVDPFSSRRWTQSTWPFMIASISGVLQGGEAAGLGNQPRSSIAPSPLSQPPRKGLTPCHTEPKRNIPINSLAVDVHDVGDVCPLPAVYQEVQGIGVPVGSWRQRRRKGGITHAFRRVPSFQPPPQTKGRGSCPAVRHTWLSKFVRWLPGYRID